MKSKWEYRKVPVNEQWVRERTGDGKVRDHGPFASYAEARAFVSRCKAEEQADRHDPDAMKI